MDFKTYLQTSALEINQEIDQFFDNWSREVRDISERIIPLSQAFIDACSGGKRLRGALVKFGYELVQSSVVSHQSSDNSKEVLKSAVATELFQTAILAHDDIIDLSPLRRGKPTIYKALGGDHYGVSQTICLGDVGFFLAVKLISESDFDKEKINKAVSFFTRGMIDTVIGEILDVELPHSKSKITEEDVNTISHLKTAKYTIVGPISLGAILGGADEKLLKNIEDFGTKLGIAFQIQDDILGIFGSEEVIGKSVTSDIEEGKITLLILYAQKNASVEQEEILKKHYGKGKIGNKELEKIRQIFIETGALDYSQKKANGLVIEAKKIIPKITQDLEKAKFLEEMADFLVKRDK